MNSPNKASFSIGKILQNTIHAPPDQILIMPLSHIRKFATYTVGKRLAATCGCQTDIFLKYKSYILKEFRYVNNLTCQHNHLTTPRGDDVDKMNDIVGSSVAATSFTREITASSFCNHREKPCLPSLTRATSSLIRETTAPLFCNHRGRTFPSFFNAQSHKYWVTTDYLAMPSSTKGHECCAMTTNLDTSV